MQHLPVNSGDGDLLIERLINDEPSRVGRCLSEWADPLDAAVLAACLVKQPAADIARRERAARQAGLRSEAAFWRETLDFFVAVTTPSPGAQPGRLAGKP